MGDPHWSGRSREQCKIRMQRSKPVMKILVLASDIPATVNMPGSPRLYSLCKGLARHHRLTLATLSQSQARYQAFLGDPMADGVFQEIVILPAPPKPCWWRSQVHRLYQAAHFVTRYRHPQYHADQCRKIREMFIEGGFDVIYVDGLIMAQYLADCSKFPAIIDLHDSLTLLYSRATQVEPRWLRRLQLYSETKSIGRQERTLSRVFSTVVTNSRVDEEFLKVLDPSANTLTIGNGVDSEFFGVSDVVSDKSRLVFTGVMNYGPNEDAAIFFCDAILPLIHAHYPQVQFWIVGKDPTEKVGMLAGRPGVHVTGGVDDIRPYLETAGIYVCPIRYGAGIKNKILAALSMKKAVVATRVSIEGLDLRDNEHLIIADEPEKFAAQVIRLLEDPALVERLGRNGQALVSAGYSWESSASQLEDILLAATSAKSRSDRSL